MAALDPVYLDAMGRRDGEYISELLVLLRRKRKKKKRQASSSLIFVQCVNLPPCHSFFPKTCNHRIVEVGRDLKANFSNLLLKHDHLEWVT